jgi:hypothetical protein
MIPPAMSPRMKKASYIPGFGIDPTQVCTFVQVAIDTGEGEVFETIIATMHLRNYVFDMERSKR